MASLIPGYEYDIFISYRQKDNKHDGWVTEFVDQLKGELGSTFKEEVSVYFDINPDDGLLETHNVDKSLAGKLRCLIFIPIISQTYCDLKSYAWQNEFCAFNRLLKEDKSGREIKLASGNVASRILPVKIHDLDPEDKKLIENELGGILRSVEFIYKSPGVNRPLRSNEDHPQDNLNKTYYRDQINKVANAIKEIIYGLQTGSAASHDEQTEAFTIPDNPDVYGKSIAVLPFVDMSPEKDQEYFCDGISEEIINALSHIENFKVIARTSAFAFKNKQADIREIGNRLDVEVLVEGSIRKAGNQLRITAQLIKVADGSHIWSERFDREMKDVFAIQDEISRAITDNLKVKLLGEKKTTITKQPTENLEAYNFYLKGIYYWQKFTLDGFKKASEYFEQALGIDPEFALAYIGLANVLGLSTFWGNVPLAEGFPKIIEHVNKAMKIDNTLAEAYAFLGQVNTFYFWNSNEADRNFKTALQINPNSSLIHIDYAVSLALMGRNEEAISVAKRAKELDPLSWYINSRTGDVFAYAGQYEKAIEEYKISLTINPDHFLTHFQLGLSYSEKKKPGALAEFKKAADLSAGNPLVIAALIVAYYRIWKKGKANKLFENLKKRSANEYIPAACFFMIHLVRGEEDTALEWLKRACIEHDSILPYFRLKMLKNPRSLKYINLLKEMGMDYVQ